MEENMNWNSTNHPISDLRDWDKEKKLEIRPDFQRREVWSKAAKIMLIDTIIRDIPMPKFYLETKVSDEHPTFRVVIDGQQRITAILDYLNGNISMPNDYDIEGWGGKHFSELSEANKNKFLNYELNVNNLVNPTEKEVRDLYSRVNKYTVQLNKQELRKCDYPGDFINIAESLIENSFFDDARLFTAAMTRRMNDIEFVEELVMVILEGIQDKKNTIDEFCEKYKKIDNYNAIREKFEKVIEDIKTIFTLEGNMFISSTRFRKRSDFYTIFSVINSLHSDGKELNIGKIKELQENLDELNRNLKPISENDDYSQYAIRCSTDANSLSSRKWRQDFIMRFFEKAYR